MSRSRLIEPLQGSKLGQIKAPQPHKDEGRLLGEPDNEKQGRDMAYMSRSDAIPAGGPAPLGALSVIINITRERRVSGPVLGDFYTNLRQN